MVSAFVRAYYFRFVNPLWLASFSTDLLRQTSGLKVLSGHNTFVFAKPSEALHRAVDPYAAAD